jgi:N-acetyl-gamma-glutamyl-phosphate reductase
MVRVGIVGSTGYSGADLVKLLLQHPDVEIGVLTSQTYSGLPYDRVFPAFQGYLNGVCEPLDPERVAEQSDVVFTALPHTKAMECVPYFLSKKRIVVDLSADFRLRNGEVFEKWYAPHKAPQLLPQAVYGLPELYRDKIREARLVANPGCYPTSAILGAAPLISRGWVDLQSLIINAASGVTGAGRSVNLGSLFCEVNEGMKAYKVGEHRHTPEMEQEISVLAGSPVRVTFVPHLVPLSRGILTTLYADLRENLSEEEILEAYRSRYKGEPFIRTLPCGTLPNVRDVRGSNYCDIGLKVDGRTGRVVVLVAIDNLVKGASGQAIQNMNITLGLPETAGLDTLPLFV